VEDDPLVSCFIVAMAVLDVAVDMLSQCHASVSFSDESLISGNLSILWSTCRAVWVWSLLLKTDNNVGECKDFD
jgi:hypothetical protein